MPETEEKEFIGISQTTRAHRIHCLRASISPMLGDEKRLRFNKCAINSLDGFSYSTFAGWAGELHCKEVGGDELYRLQRYLVNYFLCPDATTEEELMACYYEVWPPAEIHDDVVCCPPRIEPTGFALIVAAVLVVTACAMALWIIWR